LKAKARERSVNDLMDVLVLRAQKDTSRGQNAAQDAAAPTQAAADANLVPGVF
jgi:hypothetical protein